MSNDVDQSGDYSYDLAHEVQSIWIPAQRRTSTVNAMRGVAFDPDAEGDYSYDQAHER